MIWRTIRVGKECLRSLQRYRDNLQVQVNANRVKYKRFGPSFRVSLGEAIEYLIEQKDAHTKRGRGFVVPGERPKDAFMRGQADDESSSRNGDEG